ncbi:MAG: sulfotransferase family protein [Deltaproteobacteria bacterium]|nr:sulfotransferase family protein [Deltaproteobacteria bacterium]
MSDSTPSLESDPILEEASRRARNLTDLGESQFIEGLDRLLDSLEKDGRLSPIGTLIARERILLSTVNRLNFIEDRKQNPEIAQERIVRPVIVVGMPRTGSTILHDILAQDPRSRAPLTWEVMFPSPPPTPETFDDDPRIEACDATFPDIDAQIPAFKAMHPMGARLSQECVSMMADTMCTPLFHNQFRVNTYQDWVDHDADWSRVYDFHEKQLQHLQWKIKRDRWVLKTGAHMWGLEHLLARYPDARIVFTHRDPVKSMTSYASLTSLVRSMGSDDVDPLEIAEDWTARIKRVLEHSIAVRSEGEYPDALFYDMHFQDFVADQFAVVEKIYQAFDIPMSDDAAIRMRAFIADNPKGKHGIHRYTPEEYGVEPNAIRESFRPYMERFGIEPEAL